MIVTQHVFETESDYCAFLKVLTKEGFTRHHAAKYPRMRPGRRYGHVGYCEKYNGIFGDGWKIVIFMPTTTTYNDRVIYYVKENHNG